MKKPITKEEALLSMASLCARSEQCPSDIYRKLRLKGLSHSASLDVIEDLKERKFVDEPRFARGFTNDKVRFSAWGRRKIGAALAVKRIPSELIRTALAEIDPGEYEDAALRAARAKSSGLDLELYEDRVKLYRHLLSRGFESALASKLVKSLRQ